MATYSRTIRRGLPRQSGGEAWPPAGAVPADLDEAAAEPAPEPAPANGDGVDVTTAPPPPVEPTPPVESAVPPKATTVQTEARAVRRGLPRVPGGEPWPPADDLPVTAPSAPAAHDPAKVELPPASAVGPVGQPAETAVEAATDEPKSRVETVDPAPVAAVAAGSILLRRGLPRVPGGEPWPPETAVAVKTPAAPEQLETFAEPAKVGTPAPAEAASPADVTPADATPRTPAPPVNEPPAGEDPARAAKAARTSKPRSRTTDLLLGALGLLVLALAAVFFTRWLVTLGFMQDFLRTYPGETPLPAATEPGFPAWVQWQHFFNFFLIVLIIRSGLQVRRETRPPGYWTPSWSKGGDGKISINLWFHQALDILWLLNGLVFVVLIFVTGHWGRLVPTTWEVFPNALSALIQYVSLDWPTENGWVNYNSLQMLAYFVTIFIAAPLAAISGARMSGIWPKDAKALNRAYPVEWARAVHFPVMLYFVVFIIGHVALVFATGALRNLNHMYGGQDAVNWAGFWIFFVSLLLVIGAWIAARPIVLAPIAGLFGRVSSR
ncbi:cytochrome b/b6 domain-containing protein [uncultured Arthrobacter sp.]|uniref:cytochrome b/b6 domain-containing protein n=1 Tax=uncultured Arthrobacter sp. TaxID=114050 RepID=UPI00260A3621|nr:cytochrome b/b6 domain-containing protein [uncultured Arthrobacter sp.]